MQRLLLAKLVNLLKRVFHRVVVSTTIRVNASMTVSCYRNKRDGNRMVWKP
jgi:hypothetical protein